MQTKKYTINEIFYSLQGEGCMAGVPMVFVRFSKCNMKCTIEEGEKSPGGFDCDTEFESGRKLTLDQIEQECRDTFNQVGTIQPKWLLLTGGEPGLQVDELFCDYMHNAGWKLAIETNGSIELPFRDRSDEDPIMLDQYLIDWICVSPKVAEHAIRQRVAHEIKYVRGMGQGIPKPVCNAVNQLISPAFNGNEIDKRAAMWCYSLCLTNPEWRLSIQQHKIWEVR